MGNDETRSTEATAGLILALTLGFGTACSGGGTDSHPGSGALLAAERRGRRRRRPKLAAERPAGAATGGAGTASGGGDQAVAGRDWWRDASAGQHRRFRRQCRPARGDDRRRVERWNRVETVRRKGGLVGRRWNRGRQRRHQERCRKSALRRGADRGRRS